MDLSDNKTPEAFKGSISDFPTQKAGGDSATGSALESGSTGFLEPSTKGFSDTPGSPRETVNYPLLAAIRKELEQEILAVFKKGTKTYLNPYSTTTREERIAIELEVHKNLYGDD